VWLLILIPVALWLAARLWRLVRAGRPALHDPADRRAIQDEVRLRQDGSGPTVAGGQHLR
jgi:hypothetical protein